MRKIIHIDMDAFFAAIEQRDSPALRGKPVVVGGSPSSRGVVSTCSYEARVFGIHSAMPSAEAYRRCPEAIFVRGNMTKYRAVSQQIQTIFRQYSNLIEPLSLDEAYLDVTDSTAFDNHATQIARAIRAQIFKETQLTASAGISFNKLLAKIASDVNKPNGQKVVTPEAALDFVQDLPMKKFHGVGRVTAEKMSTLGIQTGGDLRAWSMTQLSEHFGNMAQRYYEISRGIDHRPVSPTRVRKSIGNERTFAQDIHAIAEMLDILQQLAAQSFAEVQARGFLTSTLTIKVKYFDFTQLTRRKTFSQPIISVEDLRPWIACLLADTEAESRPVRLLGVSFSGFLSLDKSLAVQQPLPL